MTSLLVGVSFELGDGEGSPVVAWTVSTALLSPKGHRGTAPALHAGLPFFSVAFRRPFRPRADIARRAPGLEGPFYCAQR